MPSEIKSQSKLKKTHGCRLQRAQTDCAQVTRPGISLANVSGMFFCRFITTNTETPMSEGYLSVFHGWNSLALVLPMIQVLLPPFGALFLRFMCHFWLASPFQFWFSPTRLELTLANVKTTSSREAVMPMYILMIKIIGSEKESTEIYDQWNREWHFIRTFQTDIKFETYKFKKRFKELFYFKSYWSLSKVYFQIFWIMSKHDVVAKM